MNSCERERFFIKVNCVANASYRAHDLTKYHTSPSHSSVGYTSPKQAHFRLLRYHSHWSARHFFADRGLLAFMLGQRAISLDAEAKRPPSAKVPAAAFLIALTSKMRCTIRSALLHLTNFQQNLLNGQSLHCVDTSACHFIWVTPPLCPYAHCRRDRAG